MVLNREITAQIKSVLKKNPRGLSITDIVAAVDINRNTTGRYLENLLVTGQVEMRQLGMAKIYTLSQRLPVSAVLSISSELIMQLDKHLRIVFANEPFLSFLSVSSTDIFGKNIEYSQVLPVFEEVSREFINRIQAGLSGTEWSGELRLKERGIIFSCHIAPTVFDDGHKGVSVVLRDISEKKRADEALKAIEDRFRRIFEDGPLGMAIAGPDYRFTNVNRKFCAMLGYAQDELLSKTLMDITHPVHARRDLAQVKKLFTGEIASYRTEKQYIKKDGSVFWGAVTVSPLTDEQGNIVSTIALIEDISGRKHIEEKLRESEEKYRNVFDWANDAIMLHPLTTDAHPGQFIEVNNVACRMLGYSREELLTMGPLDILPVECRYLTEDMIRQAEKKDAFLFETQLQRKDGTVFPVESSARLIMYGGRRVWLSHLRDITSRKHAEEALRESETRYRSLAEASQDLIFVIGKDDKVEYVNSFAANLLGKHPEVIIGSPRSILFPPPVSDRQKRQLSQVFLTGDPLRTESSMVINGETQWLDHFLVPVREKRGTIKSVLGISRDMTKQKQAEEALKKSEERFRDLINTTADIVWQTDDEKRFVYVSPQVEKILGYTPDELVGHSPFEFLDPATVELSQFVFDTAVRTRQHILLHESRWIDRDGNIVVMESHATPIYNSDGTCAGFRGIDRDITDR